MGRLALTGRWAAGGSALLQPLLQSVAASVYIWQGTEQPEAARYAAATDAEEADRDVLWSRLLSAHEAGFLCGASCGVGGGGRDAAALSAAAEAMGLLTEHAYSVLQAPHRARLGTGSMQHTVHRVVHRIEHP